MRTVEIDMDIYLDMLQDRFNEVQDIWGDEASRSLFPQLLDLIEETGVNAAFSSPKQIVDNYVVNGDFRYRADYSPEDWESICDEALIYNNRHALMQF